MVDKITSPVGANDLIIKVNSIIDAIPTSTTDLTNDSGFITGITATMIAQALTYTPYDASNPDGFISSAALTSLTDTTISNPAGGQGLIYDATSGTWKNGNISSSVSWGNITGTLTDQADLNTALAGKQATITGAASSIADADLTANRALVSNSSGKVAVSSITSTKLGYLTDVTSNIQAQINGVTSAIPTSTTQLTNDSGFITGITSSMVTSALGFTPYSNANPSGYQANVLETVKVNGTALTPSTKTVNFTVPTSTTQLTNDSGYITGITSSDVTTALGFTPESTSNKTTVISNASTDTQYPSAKAVYSATNANATAIAAITTLIPAAATSTNQLADKSFVNSSISTNTAYFIGTFNSVAELEAYSGTLTNNDYAFVATTDTAGNTLYDRYKYNSSTQDWAFEYELNNSSFTAAQWAAINSGITSDSKVTRSTTAAVGGTTIPVYVNSSGVVTTCAALNTAAYVADNTLAHLAGAETFTGNKTFSGSVSLGANATATTPNASSNTTAVATTAFVKAQGYKTTVTSTDVTNALGYTPYSSANPSGYISSITSSDVTTALGFTPIASAAVTTLTDATISSPTNGQALIYDSSSGKWKNASVSVNVSYDASTSTLYIG